MSRWKDLPESLDEQTRQLVVQLRRLKDRSELSLSALESRTDYSRSSWERYLGGRALPPAGAVEQLARLAGLDPTRLLVLHETAVQARQRAEPPHDDRDHVDRDGSREPDPSPEPGTPAAPARRRGVLALVVGAAVLVVTLGAALLAVAPWEDDTEPPLARTDAYVFRAEKVYDCPVRRVDGRLSAGYSDTVRVVMDVGSSGWPVVEAQCLLRHHGQDPGPVDGQYGEKTSRATVRLQQEFQRRDNLAVDGIVGPYTWQVLRR